MTSRREILKHSGYLLMARLFARLASAPFLIYVAATLGPSLFGAFSFILASVEMLSSLSDLGMSRYGARTMVRLKEGRDRFAGMILLFQISTSLVLAAVALALLLIVAPGEPKSDIALLGIAGILLSAFVFTTETIFTGTRSFGASAILAVIGRAVYLLGGFAALTLGYSVRALMLAYVAAMAFESLLRMIYTVTRITRFSFRFPAQELATVFKGTLPFAVTGIATLVFYRSDMVIMGLLRSDQDVGIYSAAYSIFAFFIWLPIVLSRALLPGVTARYLDDPEGAERLCWFWYRNMAVLGIPIAFMVTMLTGPFFDNLMPEAFAGSILTLQILIWALPPMMMISIGFIALTVTDREHQGARTTVLTAAVIIALDIFLISRFGPTGAAIAMVAATAFWITQMQVLLTRAVFARGHGLLRTFLLPAAGGAAMAVAAMAVLSLGPYVALPAGLGAYGTVVLLGYRLERRILARARIL